ncbi:MAG: M50 family metallopeptidase [Xanthomonadaceae bacterium]|nr:M50 family metallopeptidase [Xanthomonadaceae bacterium]
MQEPTPTLYPLPEPKQPVQRFRQRLRKGLIELLIALPLSAVFLFLLYWPQLFGPSDLWTWFFSILNPPRWGDLFGLLLVFFASLWINISLHEIGHALGGGLRRMRLMILSVGPLRIERSSTGWYCRWGGNITGIGGATIMLPDPESRHQRTDLVLFVLGGSMMNLLLAVIGFAFFMIYADVSLGVRAALLVFGSTALFLGVFNLLPIRMRGWDLDGRNLLDLWRRPDVQEIRQQLFQLISLIRAGIRPRDWPPQSIPAMTETTDDVLLLQVCLMRLINALDRRDAETARACVEWIVPRYWKMPDGSRQNLAIGAASYAALLAKDLDLLQAWRPLCDGGLSNLSIQRFWLDAEYAAMLGQNDRARRLSAQARAELPKLSEAVDIQYMTETLDALDQRIAEEPPLSP